MAQARVPSIHIIYTKITTPGQGLLTIKGYPGAVAVVQQLNGLVVQPGLVMTAFFFTPGNPGYPPATSGFNPNFSVSSYNNYAAPSYHEDDQSQQVMLGNTGVGSVGSTPSLYSPMLAHPGVANASAQYYGGYPMVYDPSTLIPPWGSPYGNPGNILSSARSYHNGNGGGSIRRGPSFKSRGGSHSYSTIHDKQRLFIGNIPFATQWQDLKDFLRQAGKIFRVEIPESDNGMPKGYAIAMFYTEEDAANAINMFDKAMFNGRELNVRYDKNKRFSRNDNATSEPSGETSSDAPIAESTVSSDRVSSPAIPTPPLETSSSPTK